MIAKTVTHAITSETMHIDTTLGCLQWPEPLAKQCSNNPSQHISRSRSSHCWIACGIDPTPTIRSIEDRISSLQNDIDTITLREITCNLQTLRLHCRGIGA